MRIQHNIAALNSYRNLGVNNSGVAKNLEKLSSGYRINRAGDDAAGLAISEKMRSQITGLNTATKNANDGISLVQTAEGALTEVHLMLNRMVEIATQSSNGVYEDGVDRAALQDEMNALTDEIDRIADGTNFNKQNLLDGSLGGPVEINTIKGIKANVKFVQTPIIEGGTIEIAKGTQGNVGGSTQATFTADFSKVKISNLPNAGEIDTAAKLHFKITVGGTESEFDVNLGEATGSILDGANIVDSIKNNIKSVDIRDSGGTFQFSTSTSSDSNLIFVQDIAADTTDFGNAIKIELTGVDGVNSNPNGTATKTELDFGDIFDVTELDGATLNIGGESIKFVSGAEGEGEVSLDTVTTANQLVNALDGKFTDAKGKFDMTADGNKIVLTEKAAVDGSFQQIDPLDITITGKGKSLQIGDTNDDFNKLDVSIRDMHAEKLGIGKDDINVRTEEAAGKAIDKINNAINTVSKERGKLGAIQNRLEHTINNLSVNAENMTAAESRIRDVDMADEMMKYTKNNILVQASQAMLAQANQVPQGVLQLLQ